MPSSEWARDEALFASPEGAASLAAYKKLIASGFLSPNDKVVLFNTGLGLKYVDVVAQAMGLRSQSATAQCETGDEKHWRDHLPY